MHHQYFGSALLLSCCREILGATASMPMDDEFCFKSGSHLPGEGLHSSTDTESRCVMKSNIMHNAAKACQDASCWAMAVAVPRQVDCLGLGDRLGRIMFGLAAVSVVHGNAHCRPLRFMVKRLSCAGCGQVSFLAAPPLPAWPRWRL